MTEDLWRKLFKEMKNGASMAEVSRKYDVSRSSIYYRQATLKKIPKVQLTTPTPSEPLPDPDLADKTTAQLKAETIALHRQLERETALEEVATDNLPANTFEDEDEAKLREVQRRHKAEPNAVRERLYRALRDHKSATSIAQKRVAFEDMKAAKIASEVMLNLHKLERQAWGIEFTEGSAPVGGGGIHLHVQYVERPHNNEKIIEGETA